MARLQIIYTPEADNFRLNDIEMIGDREVGYPILSKLRKNYGKLKESFSSFPLTIGVVTFPFLFKEHSRTIYGEIENPTTHYMPLDILKKILDLKTLNLSEPLAREYFCRATTLLLTHPACLDGSLRGRREVMLGMCIADAMKAKQELGNVATLAKERGCSKIFNKLNKAKKIIGEIYPSFEDLEKFYEDVLKRFEKNKVSKDFPLYFLPTGFSFPLSYTVSLEEKVEQMKFMTQDLKEIPPEVKRVMEGPKFDKFGETKMIGSLDDLLKIIPEPKTIITDLYIVDHFPQLAEIGFDAHEYINQQEANN